MCIRDSSKTLLIATLFEEIDSDFSAYDLERLKAEGIVRPDALMFQNEPRMVFHAPESAAEEDRQLLELSRATSREMMRSFREKIVEFHVSRYPKRFDGTSGNYGSRNDLLGIFDSTLDDFESAEEEHPHICLLYTSPSPRDATLSRMPSSA